MTTSINVNRKSVRELLTNGSQSPFVIPDYQRQYSWENDQVDTLWNDLLEFFLQDDEKTYFLGSIVSFENASGEQEIIDGQQRLTTLFLLLRALLSKLSDMTADDSTKFQMEQVSSLIWQKDKLNGAIDKNHPLLKSCIIIDDDGSNGATLFNILKTGDIDMKQSSRYARNYKIIFKDIDEFARRDPKKFIESIPKLLDGVVLLPITADSQDTAMHIFQTLNDRGLPLSDADIFKAKIYAYTKEERERKNFIHSWKNIEEGAATAKIEPQNLFYYYMMYLRAQDSDNNTTTPGLRKYFSDNNFSKLYDRELLPDFDKMLDFWSVVNNRGKTIDGQDWSDNFSILKLLDVLTSYNNDWWKYPVNIFYLKYCEQPDFEQLFETFLKDLISGLSVLFLLDPGLSAAKQPILNLDIDIIKSPDVAMKLNTKTHVFSLDDPRMVECLCNPHRNIMRMLLKILAYNSESQNELLPEGWEIEHILPQKFETSLFNVDADSVRDKLESIGNKIPFEKTLNIQATNGFFEKKREDYAKSKIAIVRELRDEFVNPEFAPDDIVRRNVKVSDRLKTILKSWKKAYVPKTTKIDKSQPTEEELKQIANLRAKGLIE